MRSLAAVTGRAKFANLIATGGLAYMFAAADAAMKAVMFSGVLIISGHRRD